MDDTQLDQLRTRLQETGECNLGFSATLADAVQVVEGLGLRYDTLEFLYTTADDGVWMRTET